MNRLLVRTVCVAGKFSVSLFEGFLSTAIRDRLSVPVFRCGNGVNLLSTSAVRRCENSNPDKKTQEISSPETDQTLVAIQKEELVVLNTVEGGSSELQVDSKVKLHVEEPAQVKTEGVKSGKESLLELLGAMKVEITNKRKLNLKSKKSYESMTQYKSQPAVMESTISMFQKATEEALSQSETLDPSLVAAVSTATSVFPDHHQAESELLRQLRQRKAMTEVPKKGEMSNLGEIITDMKVGKGPNRKSASPAGQILFDDDGRGYMPDQGIITELAGVQKRKGLFSGKRLNFFSPVPDDTAVTTDAQLTLWDMDFTHQLSLSTNQLPRNGFEEMVQWTREGKLWQYPINNEAGLEDEASVPFHEHIFLEKHLEDGFPCQGPVRHFMELVVAGLSRNSDLTVQQKKEHIFWFRDYFIQKEQVLKDADVLLN